MASETLTRRIRRSWVTPKLVSKGCSNRIRISRNSIREIDTGGSSDKDVIAGLSMTLERRHVEILFEVREKFFPDSETCRLGYPGVCRNGDPSLFRTDRRPRTIQPPFGD